MSVVDFTQRPVVAFDGLCAQPPQMPRELCINLPGGVQVCNQVGYVQMGLFEYARAALQMANTALTPLSPVFRIIDVCVSIQNTLMSIKDLVGPPPKPAKFLEQLAILIQKVKELIKLLPLFTVPIIIVQTIDIMIANFQGAAAEVRTLAAYLARIQAAEIAAADAASMAGLVDCARTTAQAQLANLQTMLGTMNPMIDIINLLASLGQLGKPFPLPPFEGAPPEDMNVIADALDAAADALLVVREAIPI
jgi:hypothetical protein